MTYRRLFVKSVVTEPADRSDGVSIGPRHQTAIVTIVYIENIYVRDTIIVVEK